MGERGTREREQSLVESQPFEAAKRHVVKEEESQQFEASKRIQEEDEEQEVE